MKATERSYKVVTLELSEKEADWLKGVVQNPIKPGEVRGETEIRQSFWEALNPVLVKDERAS
jgi:hypothetical protein